MPRRHIQTRYARKLRGHIVGWALWSVKHKAEIHYAQIRPMRTMGRPPGSLPLTMDCSESTTLFYHWAGAPDPNGLAYNGSGFTGTLRHRRRISKRATRRGDFVVIGEGTGDHVVVLVQSGRWHRDPLVVSHGFEGGPLLLKLSQELRFHPGKPVTFHNGVDVNLKNPAKSR